MLFVPGNLCEAKTKVMQCYTLVGKKIRIFNQLNYKNK